MWIHAVESREALCCRGSATTGNSSVFVPEGTTRDEARRPVLMLLIGNKCQSVSAVVLAKFTISSGSTQPSPRDLPPLETDYRRLASRGRCDGAMDNWTLHCFTGPGRLTNEGEEVGGYYDGWRCWERWGLAVATPGLESWGGWSILAGQEGEEGALTRHEMVLSCGRPGRREAGAMLRCAVESAQWGRRAGPGQ